MWPQTAWFQISAICWAQFRISRNHLPRTSWGSVLMGLLSVIWYGLYTVVAFALARTIPVVSKSDLREWMPVGLLTVFLFWQLIPLFTLSSGWSLQLNKLQVYPVSEKALFGIEVLLRFTSAPEMLIVLIGAFFGLLLRTDVTVFAPFFLFLFVPLNLFLSLGVRDWMLHNFERNRFREVFAILLVSIGVLPQLVLRTSLGSTLKPYLLAFANGRLTPWKSVAQLSVEPFSSAYILPALFWIVLSYRFARRQFAKTLLTDESFTSTAVRRPRSELLTKIISLPDRLFRDPLAALLQKEFQALLRMPRFRVVFGMACLFSCVSLLPLTSRNHSTFLSHNFLSMANLYGLLMLGDVLLWNFFGFDRHAAQIYFVSPVQLETVLKAKNLTAASFICVQSVTGVILALLFRMGLTVTAAIDAIAASTVIALFFTTVGNLSSVTLPRAIDPTQTFRKQAGAKFQIWMLMCMASTVLLVGFAFLARWAIGQEWAFLGVLAVEFVVGIIAYRLSLESAARRGWERREEIIDALSKHAGPVSIQSS